MDKTTKFPLTNDAMRAFAYHIVFKLNIPVQIVECGTELNSDQFQTKLATFNSLEDMTINQ